VRLQQTATQRLQQNRCHQHSHLTQPPHTVTPHSHCTQSVFCQSFERETSQSLPTFFEKFLRGKKSHSFHCSCRVAALQHMHIHPLQHMHMNRHTMYMPSQNYFSKDTLQQTATKYMKRHICPPPMCLHVLQCIAICCSILLCGAERCYLLQSGAYLLQCGATCCKSLPKPVLRAIAYVSCINEHALVAVCCSVLQSVAECCGVLQRVVHQ